MTRANATPARTSTASLSERRNAASAKLARQRAQTLAADRRREQRKASGQADQRRRALTKKFSSKRPQPKPEGMSLSRAKAGLYNLLPEFLRTDNKSGRTAKQQAFHDSIHGADARRKRRRKRKDRQDQVIPPRPEVEVDYDRRKGGSDDFYNDGPYMDDFYEDDFYMEDDFSEDEMMPKRPRRRRSMRGRNSGMRGGLGGFGYSPALMQYESQQGAGQVPYYMAAARNAQTPNMSPAFMHAARNYDILGGSQRTAPRPIEMMSARERAEIMNMGSNFNTPNYNSPYQPSPRSEFDFFKRMVDQPQERSTMADMLESKFPVSGFPGSGPGKGATGKGASKPMSQEEARAMSTGIGSLLASGMLK
tara:strand:- start:141 stop:1232 length:1092 start_codon:yes stop_codon:yes gene_type:complete